MNFDFSYETVFVCGVNTRPIVESAKELGLEVIAVDIFRDFDLAKSADIFFSTDGGEISENGFLNKSKFSLFELTLKVLDRYDIDAILLSSGMENEPDKIKRLEKKGKIIGNKHKKIKMFGKEKNLDQIANELGIKRPKTIKVENKGELISKTNKIGYPVVLKKSQQGGGIGIRFAKNKTELIEKFDKFSPSMENLYVQEYINGTDASASVISTGGEAKCLAVNKQIIGDERLGAPRKFSFNGNIVPLEADRDIINKISNYSKAICKKTGLVGSNGIDFVISNGTPYLIEINPRFQSTIDLVERTRNTNLVEDHIRACNGEIKDYKTINGWGMKLILYATENIKTPDLTSFEEVIDIPFKGSLVRKDDPLCSIRRFGKEKNKLVKSSFRSAEKIKKFCHG